MALQNFSFIDYFKEVAEKHPDLLHTTKKPSFFRVSGITAIDEFLNGSTYAKDIVLCAESSDDANYTLDDGDYLCEKPVYAFYILKKVKTGDEDSRQQAKKAALRIAEDILSRIDYHYHEDMEGLKDFDWNSIMRYGIGPLGQNYYGIRFSFSLEEPTNLPDYDPDFWNE